jgi:hypothetical protein
MTYTLPDAEELMRRLTSMSRHDEMPEHLYPIIAKEAGRTVTPQELVEIVRAAIMAWCSKTGRMETFHAWEINNILPAIVGKDDLTFNQTCFPLFWQDLPTHLLDL